uniref:PPM-type phosphatase domain-containing protein n=1 Tax=Lactuca sativa TaxID=4236 RepID=A0A9R1W0B9_LACSA|nr:hypothetical protein LSAT_V11C400172980 [Lactuca sativa]
MPISFCLHQSSTVLCRNGIAIPLSEEDMPCYLDEKKRVEELGAYTEDGHLNCELAVMWALGGWHMKLPIVTQMVFSEDDDFMIIGCVGIWHVVSNQEVVGVANTYG